MRMSFRYLGFFVLLLLSAAGRAEDVPTRIDRFGEVQTEVFQAISKYGADQVLVIIDFDNTIKKMNNVLGSDQWFGWQLSLIQGNVQSEQRVAKDIYELIRIWEALVMHNSMSVVEPTTAARIRTIQRSGATVIVQTTRGVMLQRMTEFELTKSGIDFSASALRSKSGAQVIPVTERETQVFNPDLMGKHKPESQSWGVYDGYKGLFFSNGLDKGRAIRVLLHRLKRNFKSVILVDDSESNCRKMLSAFKNTEVDVRALHYTRLEPEIKAFNNGDKSEVHRSWKRHQKSIQFTFKESIRSTNSPAVREHRGRRSVGKKARGL